MLFLIFIKDLPEDLNSKTKLFADDCILNRQVKTDSDQLLLQQDLDKLASSENKWGMEFHPQKCSVLWATRFRSPLALQYQLKGTALTEERSTKHLGVDSVKPVMEEPHQPGHKEGKQHAWFPLAQSTTSKRSNQGLFLYSTVKLQLLLHYLESISTRSEAPRWNGST